MNYFFKVSLTLGSLIVILTTYTLIEYPYLTVIGKYAKDPYSFLLEKRTSGSFDFLGTTHYSNYKDNLDLITSSEIKKCPFYLTPDEPDNRNVLVSKDHILFDNDKIKHQDQREYVKNLVPDDAELNNRLNIWFSNNINKDINKHEDFEKPIFFILFAEKIEYSDIKLIMEYRAKAVKLLFIPPFIRNVFMGSDLDKIDSIKKRFISKFSSLGYEKPHLTFEIFWFNALPIYDLYMKSIRKLEENPKIVEQITNQSKEQEFINEIFRLYPNPRSIPYQKEGNYFSANLFLANTDSTVFSNPLKIDLDRENYNHLTFVSPSERSCLGADLTLNLLSYLIKKYIENKDNNMEVQNYSILQKS